MGLLGEIAFVSFDPTKTIDGRGGVVATNDLAFWEAIQAVSLDSPIPASLDEPERYRHYHQQLAAIEQRCFAPSMIDLKISQGLNTVG